MKSDYILVKIVASNKIHSCGDWFPVASGEESAVSSFQWLGKNDGY